MSTSDRAGLHPSSKTPHDPGDNVLLDRLVMGDDTALDLLTQRYDRLIRYTLFRVTRARCLADPFWLDSLASDTWIGFIQSLRRNPAQRPQSLPAYLVRIARNQAVTALRRENRNTPWTTSIDTSADQPITSHEDSPEALAEQADALAALRDCLSDLSATQKQLILQLPAITERRWQVASEALGISESTLRSQWKVLLNSLRRCIHGRTGKTLAPREDGGD